MGFIDEAWVAYRHLSFELLVFFRALFDFDIVVNEHSCFRVDDSVRGDERFEFNEFC